MQVKIKNKMGSKEHRETITLKKNKIEAIKIFNILVDNKNNKLEASVLKKKGKLEKRKNSIKKNISMKINMIRVWMKKKINRKAIQNNTSLQKWKINQNQI